MSPSGHVRVLGIDLGGVPRFVMGVIGLVVAVVIGYKFIVDPEIRVTTEKQANAMMLKDIAEYGRHIAEEPELTLSVYDDARGKYSIKFYSDTCLLPIRTDPDGKTFSRLIRGLSGEGQTASLADFLSVPIHAQQQDSACNYVYHGRLTGQSEPWRNGCFLYFRRFFEDGCVHVQAFDTCNNVWWAPHWEVCRH